MSSTALRWIGATGALIAAATHFSLYRDGYRDIPVANIGTQFLLNALTGIVIAIALVAPLFASSMPRWSTKIAALTGIGWSAFSLLAYTLSHADRGWMGYNDGPGFFQPGPEGAITVAAEAAVLIACIALVALSQRTSLEANSGS